MVKSIPFANAAAVVVVIISFICWIVTLVVPDLAFGIASSWFHTINLDAVRTSKTSGLGEAVVGFISLGGLTWFAVFAFAEIYNRLAKK